MDRILVFNVGNLWPANARASVEAAAARWRCEIREIDSTLGAPDILAAKFRVGHMAHPFARAMLLDFDIVIHQDCPNPFNLVPPSRIGAVLNFQGDTHEGDHAAHQKESWDLACHQLEINRPCDVNHYINGGMILFSHQHREMFTQLRTMVRDTHGVNEQAAFSLAISHRPHTYLPREFNRIGPAVWTSGPQMTAHVYHFANYFQHRGLEEKAARINATDWHLPLE